MIEAKTRAWWRATVALCLGSFLVFINLYVPQPLLPELKTAYEVSTLGVSLLMSVATLSLALSLLVFGPLSDAIGREGIMRITLLLAGAVRWRWHLPRTLKACYCFAWFRDLY